MRRSLGLGPLSYAVAVGLVAAGCVGAIDETPDVCDGLVSGDLLAQLPPHPREPSGGRQGGTLTDYSDPARFDMVCKTTESITISVDPLFRNEDPVLNTSSDLFSQSLIAGSSTFVQIGDLAGIAGSGFADLMLPCSRSGGSVDLLVSATVADSSAPNAFEAATDPNSFFGPTGAMTALVVDSANRFRERFECTNPPLPRQPPMTPLPDVEPVAAQGRVCDLVDPAIIPELTRTSIPWLQTKSTADPIVTCGVAAVIDGEERPEYLFGFSVIRGDFARFLQADPRWRDPVFDTECRGEPVSYRASYSGVGPMEARKAELLQQFATAYAEQEGCPDPGRP